MVGFKWMALVSNSILIPWTGIVLKQNVNLKEQLFTNQVLLMKLIKFVPMLPMLAWASFGLVLLIKLKKERKFFQTHSGLVPDSFRTRSGLVPDSFQTRSRLVPDSLW